MSLGSISHVQYYFSKTGQLDGKGGHLARPDQHGRQTPGSDTDGHQKGYEDVFGTDTDDEAVSDEVLDMAGLGSMLPPTASTYKAKPLPVHILPGTVQLRGQLRQALEEARSVLSSPQAGDPSAGMIDAVIQATQAAKHYYNGHHNISSLYKVRSERQLRSSLYHALELLQDLDKRCSEHQGEESTQRGLLAWTTELDEVLDEEERYETRERTLRHEYSWLHGDWQGQERERERAFLQSFTPEPLPEWITPCESGPPCAFLKALQSGIRLLQLHNEMIDRSERRFGAVPRFHTDVSKPYRRAENLRFWVSAAELRWEVKLTLNVLELVYEKDEHVWVEFDAALLKWCVAARQEISSAWLESPKLTSGGEDHHESS